MNPDAAMNLAALDIGAGHFSRIELSSGGGLPASLVSEFVHIARDHVNQSKAKVLTVEADPSSGISSEGVQSAQGYSDANNSRANNTIVGIFLFRSTIAD